MEDFILEKVIYDENVENKLRIKKTAQNELCKKGNNYFT